MNKINEIYICVCVKRDYDFNSYDLNICSKILQKFLEYYHNNYNIYKQSNMEEQDIFVECINYQREYVVTQLIWNKTDLNILALIDNKIFKKFEELDLDQYQVIQLFRIVLR